MAYSAATYKGDGSQSTFMIPFDYLQKDFVKVTINEVDKVYAQDYNVDGRELSFPTAPPSGSIIKIYRETPTDRMVKWNEGSVLTSSNMTTQQIQELHLIEETAYNLNISSMMKTEDNHKWEGQYLPITHVGDPTDDSDVINLGTIKKEETGFLTRVKSQLDTWLTDLGTTYNNYSKSLKDSFDSYTSSLKEQFDTYTANLLGDFNNYKDTLKTDYATYTSNLSTTFTDYKDTLMSKYNAYLASLTATKDAVKDSEANASKYRDEAKDFSDSAKESANQCVDSVTTCTTRVAEANQAKETAGTYAGTATTKATESGNSAALAKKWAVYAESPDGAVDSKSAKTWAEEAKASEQKATTSANNAKTSEGNAKTSEIASALSAKNAQSAEANAKKSESASATSATAAKSSEVNAKASEVAAAESAKQAAKGQINADWNETNADSKAFIKNKPDVPTRADIANSVTTKTLTVSGETSVPTANAGNSSNAIASTAFVAKSIASLVGSAPESLNTLNELAKALGNDPNFATTIINELAKKLNSTEAENTYVKQGGVNLWKALHNNTTSNLNGLTNAQWNSLGFFIRYFAGSGAFENQPSTFGQLINISAGDGNSVESTQLFIEQSRGVLYFRSGNGSTAIKDMKFKEVAYWSDDKHLAFPNGAEMWVS